MTATSTTTSATTTTASTGPAAAPTTHAASTASLIERIAAVADSFGARDLDGDRARALPFEQVRELAAAGLGTLRVPAELGGPDVSHAELFGLVVRIAAADSNVAQVFRAHFGLVEMLRLMPPSDVRDRWLSAASAGKLFGNGTTEPGRHPGDPSTSLRGHGGTCTLNGVKFYCTGTLFADFVAVTADDPDGVHRTVIVPVDRDGVELVDDWTGMGQRVSGSGTSRFTDVAVLAGEVLPDLTGDARTIGAFYQLQLSAVIAGIARRVSADSVGLVTTRTRHYAHGVGDSPRHDPLVQERVGELAAVAFAAEALVLHAARALDRAAATHLDTDVAEAFTATAAAQAYTSEEVVAAADALFGTASASALAIDRALDRHWRNARTIASHNSVAHRLAAVGALLVGGAHPEYGGW